MRVAEAPSHNGLRNGVENCALSVSILIAAFGVGMVALGAQRLTGVWGSRTAYKLLVGSGVGLIMGPVAGALFCMSRPGGDWSRYEAVRN
jgi:hypothetical protein